MSGEQAERRNISGWLAVDKPEGMGSTDAVALARRAFAAKKAGHAGTLDRPATGLLLVALGEATKTVLHAMNTRKTYRFDVIFGAATTTDDATGEVIAESDARPSRSDILSRLPEFTGTIMQRPPRYSAIKIAGKRAAAIAASGGEPEIAEREIAIHRLELLDMPSENEATFEMQCGKGGYVRSIARDLGEALGCLGHVGPLRRLSIGAFSVDDSVPGGELEDLANRSDRDRLLKPVEAGLASLPEMPCAEDQARQIRSGNPGVVAGKALKYGEAAWASCEGRAVAIGVYRNGRLFPRRVFVQAES